MNMDFNDAESNSSFDLIPSGTVAPMILTIKPGATGEGGWETTSATSSYTWLSCEFTITGGKYANRKFWGNMMVSGPSEQAINITRSTLRGILESGRGIKPDDDSDDAKKKRMVANYGDFSGLEFVGKIGIEKGKDGYEDKNKLVAAVPVTSKDYAAAKSGASASGSSAPAPSNSNAPASGGAVPAWAN